VERSYKVDSQLWLKSSKRLPHFFRQRRLQEEHSMRGLHTSADPTYARLICVVFLSLVGCDLLQKQRLERHRLLPEHPGLIQGPTLHTKRTVGLDPIEHSIRRTATD
jgi:hypothetical protein